MGLAPSRKGARLSSNYSSGVDLQGTYRKNQPKNDEDGVKRHTVAGPFLAEKNVNNAHNRYSNADVGCDYPVTTPFFHQWSTTCPDEVRILRISVGIENKCIQVDEGSRSVLKYKTPHFRARATVEIPELSDRKKFEVGWIQVCHQMQCVNVYGQEGITSWEFPEIVLGKFEMVSDSDGKRYPWYGTKHEVQVVEGPTDQRTSVTVLMHDNFFPQITWHIPAKGYSREPRLTHIYRKQKFFTFLAVREIDRDAPKNTLNCRKNDIRVLHAVEWTMEVDISADPSLPIGYRVKSVAPKTQEEVAILDAENSSLLKAYALEPPNANNSQALIWRPFSNSAAHKPSIVVKPLHSTVTLDNYLNRTNEFGNRLINNWISINKAIATV